MDDSALTQFVRLERRRLAHRLHYARQATCPAIRRLKSHLVNRNSEEVKRRIRENQIL